MAKWSTAGYYHLVKKFWDERCAYCMEKVEGVITKDHFIPKSKRGQNHKFNLVPACVKCNTAKCNKHPNDWCGDYQRNQIGAYFNALLLVDVQTYKNTKMPVELLAKAHDQYLTIRRRFKSTAKIWYGEDFSMSWLEKLAKDEKKKARKTRTVDEIIAAWRAGDVTGDTVHRAEQVRSELCPECTARRAVRDDDRDVWRTSDGLHILH